MQTKFTLSKGDGYMYTDEQILKIRQKMEQQMQQKEKSDNLESELQQSIFDGTIQIYGNDVTFERREICEFGISILMPQVFEMLDEDMRKMVYPSSNGPQHVFTSEDEYMNISFKQNNNIIKKEQLKEFVNLSKRLMEISGPKVKIVKTGEIEQDEMLIGTMEFISNAIDGVAYTYMGFLPLETGVLLICVVFKNNQKKRLCPVAKEILQSIQLLEQEAEV